MCSETTDYGSYIVYNLNQPYKEPDEAHSKYKFLYFEYNDSNKILDLNNVTESGWVHPVFEGTLREFNITWIIKKFINMVKNQFIKVIFLKKQVIIIIIHS